MFLGTWRRSIGHAFPEVSGPNFLETLEIKYPGELIHRPKELCFQQPQFGKRV
jgi:hypothetical protein